MRLFLKYLEVVVVPEPACAAHHVVVFRREIFFEFVYRTEDLQKLVITTIRIEKFSVEIFYLARKQQPLCDRVGEKKCARLRHRQLMERKINKQQPHSFFRTLEGEVQ